jgi:hypothetical protein
MDHRPLPQPLALLCDLPATPEGKRHLSVSFWQTFGKLTPQPESLCGEWSLEKLEVTVQGDEIIVRTLGR